MRFPQRFHNFYHSLSRTTHTHAQNKVYTYHEYILGSLIYLSYTNKQEGKTTFESA